MEGISQQVSCRSRAARGGRLDLEQEGELRIAEGDVLRLGNQALHAVAQGGQRLVDVLGLLQAIALQARRKATRDQTAIQLDQTAIQLRGGLTTQNRTLGFDRSIKVGSGGIIGGEGNERAQQLQAGEDLS